MEKPDGTNRALFVSRQEPVSTRNNSYDCGATLQGVVGIILFSALQQELLLSSHYHHNFSSGAHFLLPILLACVGAERL